MKGRAIQPMRRGVSAGRKYKGTRRLFEEQNERGNVEIREVDTSRWEVCMCVSA